MLMRQGETRMIYSPESILIAVTGLCLGTVIGYLLRKKMTESKMESIEKSSQKIIEDANKEAEALNKEAVLQAKEYRYRMKLEFEKETKDRRLELQKMEKRILQKEENLEKKTSQVEEKEQELAKKEQSFTDRAKNLEKKEAHYKELLEEQMRTLEELSGISALEAKNMLLSAMENEARHDAAKLIKQIENDARETADKRSKEILALAIKRYSGDYIVEKAVSVVILPSDDMKGRIIGREGRNIRSIEAATGVDLIIDDTPEAVIVSAFDPIRREVAKQSIERLINDGRIHPARIEEIVEKVSQEMEVSLREAGEQATFDVGVHGVHPELQKLIGKLKFRSSYGQNVYQHSLEVAFLCGVMAAELGLNVKQAKRAGLLHDIGKAVDHEVEGAHAAIGADLCKRYGESPAVLQAVAAHHEEVAPISILDVLVQAADTLSGARPGARREMLETYLKRLEDLEKISNSFKGVAKSYALQAGREIRIMVESDKISDEEAMMLSRDIAKRVENELVYPGQIKVTVIRETRAVEYAK
jgi:ribonuclease Y